ncbi:chemotaxis protein, resembles cheA [Lelliottia jeotgali]|nr:chemotaxis protein, resembles cheA [Lelliottia jeotgali]
MTNTGFIIGAYPCAPSFHQKGEMEEREFWRQLADTPDIRGLEQPCLENLHPLGDAWLFRHTPGDWEIVVTAVMETMRRRGVNGGFGLASADETQRRESVAFYRQLLEKIVAVNARFPGKVTALEMQAAPQSGNGSVEQATDAFSRSIAEIANWDWPCDLVLEHCDAMTGTAPRKGFLPLENVLDVLRGTDISVCINWARSAIEGRNTSLPLAHVQATLKAGKLGALMFSGTTATGEYGDWQDLHAPFSSFCTESLMSSEHVNELFTAASAATLKFSGIKLLEINANADVSHRIAILRDGISVLKKAAQ